MSKKLTQEFIALRTKCDRLESIKNLNLWGNDLEDISIIKNMPNLEVVSLSVNKIRTLKDFSYLRNLRELYLRKNSIAEINEVKYLVNLPNLRVLWLSENPVVETKNYRSIVIKILPQITKLDDNIISKEERLKCEEADTMPEEEENALDDYTSNNSKDEENVFESQNYNNKNNNYENYPTNNNIYSQNNSKNENYSLNEKVKNDIYQNNEKFKNEIYSNNDKNKNEIYSNNEKNKYEIFSINEKNKNEFHTNIDKSKNEIYSNNEKNKKKTDKFNNVGPLNNQYNTNNVREKFFEGKKHSFNYEENSNLAQNLESLGIKENYNNFNKNIKRTPSVYENPVTINSLKNQDNNAINDNYGQPQQKKNFQQRNYSGAVGDNRNPSNNVAGGNVNNLNNLCSMNSLNSVNNSNFNPSIQSNRTSNVFNCVIMLLKELNDSELEMMKNEIDKKLSNF
jgi:hypothetical protein